MATRTPGESGHCSDPGDVGEAGLAGWMQVLERIPRSGTLQAEFLRRAGSGEAKRTMDMAAGSGQSHWARDGCRGQKVARPPHSSPRPPGNQAAGRRESVSVRRPFPTLPPAMERPGPPGRLLQGLTQARPGSQHWESLQDRPRQQKTPPERLGSAS